MSILHIKQAKEEKAERKQSQANARADGSPGIFGFWKDVVLGVVGMEPSGEMDESTPEGRRQAQQKTEYPWIAFKVPPKALEKYGADGKKAKEAAKGQADVIAYRNKFTGAVQLEKPSDFDEKSKAAKQLDTETTAIVVAREEKSRWQHYADILGASPVLEMIKDAGDRVQKSEVGKAATSAVNQVRETTDQMQDRWETSQSP